MLLNVIMLKNFSAETDDRASRPHVTFICRCIFRASLGTFQVMLRRSSSVCHVQPRCSPTNFYHVSEKRDIQFHYCTYTKLEEMCARMGCAPELRLSTLSSQPQRPALHWSRKQIFPCVRFRTTESRFKIGHLVIALTSCCNNTECTNSQNRMCKYKIQ